MSEDDIHDELDEAREVIPFTYSITSYGADYPVESLVRKVRNGDVLVPTFEHEDDLADEVDPFQREYVWTRSKADRFIESLLLGLPVPGIFLVKEADGRFLVLDGHQRLFTLRSFYDGVIAGREYQLTGVQERFEGRRYQDLDTEDRRRLDDSIVHATVTRQDQPDEDQSSIYIIFERLNTGGISLQPQEIRMALYHGDFARLLRQLNENENWRNLVGPRSKRLKDVELILRFFALYYFHTSYAAPMKDFLNRYMATNRALGRQSDADITAVFEDTARLIRTGIGEDAFRPTRAVNAAAVDSIMVGIASNLLEGHDLDAIDLRARHAELLADDDYRSAITTGTSQEPKVRRRIEIATAKFKP